MRSNTRPSLTTIVSVAVLRVVPFLTLATTSATWADVTSTVVLDNGLVAASFDHGHLVRLRNAQLDRTITFSGDSADVTIDGKKLSTDRLKILDTRAEKELLVTTYRAGETSLQVVYELRPGWRFVSKQLVVSLPKGSHNRIGAVEVIRADLLQSVASEHRINGGSRGVLLRFGEPGQPPTAGLFQTLQNPFMDWRREGKTISMAYAADMEWREAYGPFASDRACFGLYRPSGVLLPAHAVPEWKYLHEPEKTLDQSPQVDLAEIEALADCVRKFIITPPQKSLRVHVGWCENDYQIDVSKPEGRAEYKRILDQAANVGCDDVLFGPANGDVSRLQDNADAWGWENLLWLGLGQKIRRGEWDIEKDPIPPSIQEMLDYARAKNLRLLAYVYPTLGWKQNAEWTRWCEGKTGGYVGVDTGVRSFQDWFVDRLVAFQKRTGLGGYSFDHWWIAYEPTKEGFKPTSKYAQWYGCRRILEELRRRVPDIVIDGRQQYQWFGPWTWLGGSYPHPTTNDEQPGSFTNFPDLHFSRVSGDRQRWAAWYYRVDQYTPVELLPGYMTHQTPRSDAQGQCIRDHAFQARDWDCLGWRYSVISSIGTAPFNHVVNLLPARDESEFQHFRPDDQQWLRHWLDWTDSNRAILRNVRPIIGPPVLGRVDGTAAIAGKRGFVFLFNPNYRELNAEFTLDASIGLTQGDKFLLRELYPREARWRGKPHAGPWSFGDRVSLAIKGPEALVLEVVPANEVCRPVLLGAGGKAVLDGNRLALSDVKGEAGRTVDLTVLLPADQKPEKIAVNGHAIAAFAQEGDTVTLPVTFGGVRFDHCQQIGNCDHNFTEKVFRSEFMVPQRVFSQLAARRKAWPIPYTKEELLATWRGSDRLLLYIHIAEPNDKWEVGLKIDGQPVEVKRAYSDVYPLGRERTFTGFYADVSYLKPDVPHKVEVRLPDNLQPGQFQGLFFENVEAEFVPAIAAVAVPKTSRGNGAVPATISLRSPGNQKEENL